MCTHTPFLNIFCDLGRYRSKLWFSFAGSNGCAAAGIRSVCVQRAVIVGYVRVGVRARLVLPVGGTREEEEEARKLQASLACVVCACLRFSNKDKVPIPHTLAPHKT